MLSKSLPSPPCSQCLAISANELVRCVAILVIASMLIIGRAKLVIANSEPFHRIGRNLGRRWGDNLQSALEDWQTGVEIRKGASKYRVVGADHA